jgi:hypothetical protein
MRRRTSRSEENHVVFKHSSRKLSLKLSRECVLHHRFAGLDVLRVDAMLSRPLHKDEACELRAVVPQPRAMRRNDLLRKGCFTGTRSRSMKGVFNETKECWGAAHMGRHRRGEASASSAGRIRAPVPTEDEDFERLATHLSGFGRPVVVGLEPTADYHRPIAHFLLSRGLDMRLVSSLAVARTREALRNSWDKNDPLDAQVILHRRQ